MEGSLLDVVTCILAGRVIIQVPTQNMGIKGDDYGEIVKVRQSNSDCAPYLSKLNQDDRP